MKYMMCTNPKAATFGHIYKLLKGGLIDEFSISILPKTPAELSRDYIEILPAHYSQLALSMDDAALYCSLVNAIIEYYEQEAEHG